MAPSSSTLRTDATRARGPPSVDRASVPLYIYYTLPRRACARGAHTAPYGGADALQHAYLARSQASSRISTPAAGSASASPRPGVWC